MAGKKITWSELPVQSCLHQWTQFEEFPRFIEGVKEVRQLDDQDDQRLRWRVENTGEEKKWTAQITEQNPNHRIAWSFKLSEYTSGQVDFARSGTDRTRVVLE